MHGDSELSKMLDWIASDWNSHWLDAFHKNNAASEKHLISLNGGITNVFIYTCICTVCNLLNELWDFRQVIYQRELTVLTLRQSLQLSSIEDVWNTTIYLVKPARICHEKITVETWVISGGWSTYELYSTQIAHSFSTHSLTLIFEEKFIALQAKDIKKIISQQSIACGD